MVDGTAELESQTKPAQTEAMAEVRGLKKKNKAIKTTIKTLVEDHVQALHDQGRHEDVAELRTVANERFGLADASAHATRTEGKIAREVGEAIVGKIDQLNDSDGEVVTTDATVQHDADVSSRGAAIDSHMRSMVQVVVQVSDDGVDVEEDALLDDMFEDMGEFGEVDASDGDLIDALFEDEDSFGEVVDSTVDDNGVDVSSEISGSGVQSEAVDLPDRREPVGDVGVSFVEKSDQDIKLEQASSGLKDIKLEYAALVSDLAKGTREVRAKEMKLKKAMKKLMATKKYIENGIQELKNLDQGLASVKKEIQEHERMLEVMHALEKKLGGSVESDNIPPKPKAAAAVAEVSGGDDVADTAMRLEVSRGDSIMRPSTAGRAREAFETFKLGKSSLMKTLKEEMDLANQGIEQNGKLTKEQAERLEYLHNRSEKESAELEKYIAENSECLTDDMLEQIKVIQKRVEAAKKERDELLSRLFKMEGFKESMHHFSANFLDSVVGMYIDVRNENQFTNFARKLHNDELELQRAEDKSYATKQYEKQMHRLNAEGKKVFNEALEEIRHRAAGQSG